MDLYKLLVLQFIAHFLSDYLFQSPKWSLSKDKGSFKSKELYKHTAVTFLFSAALSFDFLFIIFSLLIASVHMVLDGFKKKIKELKILKKYTFFIDQLLHLLTVTGVVFLYFALTDVYFYFELPDLKYLIYIFAFLLMLKPANILIREIFLFYEIKLTNDEFKDEELPNAGKLIGIVERVLSLLLIILGEFAVIGFLLAAKSLLRFREAQAPKAEYVLIGTLLSFAIAVITGIFVKYIIEML